MKWRQMKGEKEVREFVYLFQDEGYILNESFLRSNVDIKFSLIFVEMKIIWTFITIQRFMSLHSSVE